MRNWFIFFLLAENRPCQEGGESVLVVKAELHPKVKSH